MRILQQQKCKQTKIVSLRESAVAVDAAISVCVISQI